MILFICTALGMPRKGDCAFAIAICCVNAEKSVFSLNHVWSATSFLAGKPPVPFAHISMPFGPDIHLTNRHAASLFCACVVTVLSEPRTIVPVVTPAGSGEMSYVMLVGGSTCSVAVVAYCFLSAFVSFFAANSYSSQVFGAADRPAALKRSVL